MEDFKPASSNQGGKEYPQVNSEHRARFRIVAPQAQSVRVPEWGGITLTKGEDGAWVGTTRPLDEGFHYYRINIDSNTFCYWSSTRSVRVCWASDQKTPYGGFRSLSGFCG